MRPAESRGMGNRVGRGGSSGGRAQRGTEERVRGGGASAACHARADARPSNDPSLPLLLPPSGPPVFITADPPCTAAARASSQGAWGLALAGMPFINQRLLIAHSLCAGYLHQMMMFMHNKLFGYWSHGTCTQDWKEAQSGPRPCLRP